MKTANEIASSKGLFDYDVLTLQMEIEDYAKSVAQDALNRAGDCAFGKGNYGYESVTETEIILP